MMSVIVALVLCTTVHIVGCEDEVFLSKRLPVPPADPSPVAVVNSLLKFSSWAGQVDNDVATREYPEHELVDDDDDDVELVVARVKREETMSMTDDDVTRHLTTQIDEVDRELEVVVEEDNRDKSSSCSTHSSTTHSSTTHSSTTHSSTTHSSTTHSSTTHSTSSCDKVATETPPDEIVPEQSSTLPVDDQTKPTTPVSGDCSSTTSRGEDSGGELPTDAVDGTLPTDAVDGTVPPAEGEGTFSSTAVGEEDLTDSDDDSSEIVSQGSGSGGDDGAAAAAIAVAALGGAALLAAAGGAGYLGYRHFTGGGGQETDIGAFDSSPTVDGVDGVDWDERSREEVASTPSSAWL